MQKDALSKILNAARFRKLHPEHCSHDRLNLLADNHAALKACYQLHAVKEDTIEI